MRKVKYYHTLFNDRLFCMLRLVPFSSVQKAVSFDSGRPTSLNCVKETHRIDEG